MVEKRIERAGDANRFKRFEAPGAANLSVPSATDKVLHLMLVTVFLKNCGP